jgi:hypothetical protein
MSIISILKVTLPHSFELIGFWLSGAIGFCIAWNIVQFIRGKKILFSYNSLNIRNIIPIKENFLLFFHKSGKIFVTYFSYIYKKKNKLNFLE